MIFCPCKQHVVSGASQEGGLRGKERKGQEGETYFPAPLGPNNMTFAR